MFWLIADKEFFMSFFPSFFCALFCLRFLVPSRRVSDLFHSLYNLNAQNDMDMAFKDVKISLWFRFTILHGSLCCSFPSWDDAFWANHNERSMHVQCVGLKWNENKESSENEIYEWFQLNKLFGHWKSRLKISFSARPDTLRTFSMIWKQSI